VFIIDVRGTLLAEARPVIRRRESSSLLQRGKMKKLIMSIAGYVALAPGLALAATFTGEIMDEACADDAGYAAMFKKMGTNDPKQCTLACVKGGSKYVLFESGKT
jgi:hypothetical protein